jgi:hypothetical protein
MCPVPRSRKVCTSQGYDPTLLTDIESFRKSKVREITSKVQSVVLPLFVSRLRPCFSLFNWLLQFLGFSFTMEGVVNCMQTVTKLVDEYVNSWYVEYSKNSEPPDAMRQVC